MAIGADRRIVIFGIDMAIGAFQLGVNLIEAKTGYRMPEVLLIPPGVTVGAIAVH